MKNKEEFFGGRSLLNRHQQVENPEDKKLSKQYMIFENDDKWHGLSKKEKTFCIWLVRMVNYP